MNDTPQLKTYDMGDGIVAFSTTRHGGVSPAPFDSLNLADHHVDISAPPRCRKKEA